MRLYLKHYGPRDVYRSVRSDEYIVYFDACDECVAYERVQPWPLLEDGPFKHAFSHG